MNNKEFIAELARRTKSNTKETQQRMNFLIKEITEHLCNEDMISISNFGTFETKKRLERVLVSPTTGQRMLVPPKMVVGFKQSNVLKSKIQ
ncbi:MAG: HU family DNA-binding protein [Bacteroidaceae bacterium]|nr:HU family DNA-binding protein [Bacteroidaceae bacterium]MBO5794303.1 HU family DNA-binding protein [Bacteroidaceae bacterium]MBQ5655644.1 HU family DNA-binding protein [Bacteroidaceae bacterium]MEE0985382.1 HU family DNA-binding protein [Bacteroidaceae bacterium]